MDYWSEVLIQIQTTLTSLHFDILHPSETQDYHPVFSTNGLFVFAEESS